MLCVGDYEVWVATAISRRRGGIVHMTGIPAGLQGINEQQAMDTRLSQLLVVALPTL